MIDTDDAGRGRAVGADDAVRRDDVPVPGAPRSDAGAAAALPVPDSDGGAADPSGGSPVAAARPGAAAPEDGVGLQLPALRPGEPVAADDPAARAARDVPPHAAEPANLLLPPPPPPWRPAEPTLLDMTASAKALEAALFGEAEPVVVTAPVPADPPRPAGAVPDTPSAAATPDPVPSAGPSLPMVVPAPLDADPAPARRRMAAILLRPTPRRLALVAPFVIVALLVGRLLVAPLTIPVSGWLAAELAARTGVPIEVERVSLRVGASALHIRIAGVRGERAALSASLGVVEITQGLGWRTVAVDGPRLELRPHGDPLGSLPRPDAAVALLDRALGELSRAASAAGLTELAVRDGRAEIVDAGRSARQARAFDAIEGTLRFGGARTEGRLSAVGAAGRVGAHLVRAEDASGTLLSISAAGLVPADLGPVRAVRDGFRLAPVLEATVAPDGSVASASLVLGIGSGTVVFASDPPRTLDAGQLQLALDGDRLVVDNTAFVAGGSRLELAGSITPGATPEAPWLFALEAPVARFDSPDIADGPVDLSRLEAAGSIDVGARLVRIERLAAATPTGRLDAVLDFDFSGGPRLSGAAHIGPSAIPTLLGAWPPVIAYDPRLAILNTVLGGFVASLDIELALTPLELDGNPETSDMIEDAIRIDGSFAGMTLATPELPIAIQRAHGAIRMKDKTLSVRLDGGFVTAGEAGEITVEEAYLTIEPLGGKPPVADITARVKGPLAAVVELSRQLKLPQVEDADLSPADVSGTVEATLALKTPLGPAVAMDEREWSIDARLVDAATTVPIGGQTFADANIEVLINPRRLAARGRASVDGIRVDVNYSELFAGETSGGARFVLTDRDRRQKGFDTGDMVRGPVVVTVDANVAAAATGRPFTADLTEADVNLPGLSKQAGEALVAEGNIVGNGTDITVQDLTVEGSGLSIGGTVSLDGKGLAAATLDPFSLGRGDDARLAVERAGDGYRVWLDATDFDARGLVASVLKPGGGTAKLPPLEVSATGSRVRLRGDATLSDVSLEAKRGEHRMERLAFSALVDGASAGKVAIRLAPEGEGRRLQGDVAALGRVLAALGVYARMRGGVTTLDARLADDGAMAGRLVVQGFVLAGEEKLESLIAQAQRDQSRDPGQRVLAFQAAAGSDGGLAFERLTIDFTKTGDIITIREANLRGPMLGGTADGTVDLKSGELRLNGTLIPAYGVNNLFGRVPLVGEILGGGNKGGLIGVTFQAAGPLANPAFSVNPLSAVAPGIFRRIFEFR